MKLEPTSERMIEEYRGASQQSYLIYLFHIATYDYVRELVRGKDVLDFGCGTGYGTARLADRCAKITGIDISAEAVAHAGRKYRHNSLTFMAVAPVEERPLPFPNERFDVVLSFQVIEHVRDVSAYLSEINRVLRPGGLLVVATPDRSSRLLPLQKPWNMWHIREYSDTALRNLIGMRFSNVTIKKMGGRPDVIAIETKRTKWLRWLLLPLTLLFLPDSFRISGLKAVQRVGRRLLPILSRQLTQTRPASAQAVTFSFDASDLWISDHANPSVNLIALAYREPI
jgi:SAM-dependent methyltransferase